CPPLRLDDLFVAFRVVERGGELGCSIDPREQNLAALNQWLAQNSAAASADSVKARFPKMAQVLGRQDVRIFGVPGGSYCAERLEAGTVPGRDEGDDREVQRAAAGDDGGQRQKRREAGDRDAGGRRDARSVPGDRDGEVRGGRGRGGGDGAEVGGGQEGRAVV